MRDEPQLTGLQRQMLAETRGPGDVAALQLGQRRVESLEHAQCSDVDPADHSADGVLTQEPRERFDLG